MSPREFTLKITPIQDKLFRFAVGMVRESALAEDIVQEVFLRLWKRREQLHRINCLEAWCMTMTRNLSLDKLKSRHRRLTALPEDRQWEDHGPGPDRQAELKEKVSMVEACMKTLSEKQQIALHLREVEGMAYQEIADYMDETLTQVKTLIHRGRKQIVETLQKADEYGL